MKITLKTLMKLIPIKIGVDNQMMSVSMADANKLTGGYNKKSRQYVRDSILKLTKTMAFQYSLENSNQVKRFADDFPDFYKNLGGSFLTDEFDLPETVILITVTLLTMAQEFEDIGVEQNFKTVSLNTAFAKGCDSKYMSKCDDKKTKSTAFVMDMSNEDRLKQCFTRCYDFWLEKLNSFELGDDYWQLEFDWLSNKSKIDVDFTNKKNDDVKNFITGWKPVSVTDDQIFNQMFKQKVTEGDIAVIALHELKQSVSKERKSTREQAKLLEKLLQLYGKSVAG